MLDTIGDSAIRMSTKIDANTANADKDVAIQQTDKIAEERPIEQSGKGTKSDLEQSGKGGTSKYNLSEGQIVFEKYDKNGNIILRIPPNEKPVDEIA